MAGSLRANLHGNTWWPEYSPRCSNRNHAIGMPGPTQSYLDFELQIFYCSVSDSEKNHTKPSP